MNLFSSYAHPFEKTVNRFFRGIRSSSDPKKIHLSLEQLMQQNTIVVNLWMEKRFKNYTHLTKRKRRELYANAEIIGQTFDQFAGEYLTPGERRDAINHVSTKVPPAYQDQLMYMSAIMAFLKPGQRYQYIPTASFGRLLQNPQHTVLEGDCNQIVTLYTYLYARKYPIADLSAKLLPEHVCLHLQGIDIEATNATFQHYAEHQGIVPITELIAINLLDVSDFREMTAKLSQRSMVEGAKLAYVISSNRELVRRNLVVAYHNLSIYATEQKQFPTALFYARQTNDSKLLEYVQHAAALYFIKQRNFTKGRFFAEKLSDATVRKTIIRSTYVEEYNVLTKTVQNDRTLQSMKKHAGTYRKMLNLAKKADLTEQTAQLQKLLQQL